MNILIKDVLSNPTLLNNVSEEVLQQWKQQYPYVSLFHLYALKKKTNYTNVDLHNTAFHFNNREKLYYLLQEETILQYNQPAISSNYSNNTSITTDISTTDNNTNDKKNSVAETILVETKNEILDTTIKEEQTIEIQAAATTPTNTITNTDETLSIADKILLEIQQLKKEREQQTTHEVNEVANTIEESISVEIPTTEVVTSKVDEIIDINLSDENNIIALENPTATIQNDNIEETNKEIEIATKNEVENNTDNTANNIEKTAESLSIADKILFEIEQLKKEKENPVVVESISIENKISEEESKRETQDIAVENNNPTETTIATTEYPENTETTNTEQSSYSIQDEVIARIQKLKEERENPTSISEQVVSNNIVDDNKTQSETVIENTIEEIKNIDVVDDEIKEITTTEQASYSIQDEVIARIQKIKEERELALLQKEDDENNIENNVIKEEVNSEVTSNIEHLEVATTEVAVINENEVEIVEQLEIKEPKETIVQEITTAEENSIIENEVEIVKQLEKNEFKENNVQEIAIVEKDILSKINIKIDEEAAIENSNEVAKEIVVKEIDPILIEEKIKNIIGEKSDEVIINEVQNKTLSLDVVDAKAISNITVHEKETIETTDDSRYMETFPTPLLVKINVEEIIPTKVIAKPEEIVETKQESTESIPDVVKENISTENKIERKETTTSKEEKEAPAIVIENTTKETQKIVEKVDAIFIPDIDTSINETENINIEIPAVAISVKNETENTDKTNPTKAIIEAVTKDEPHTFIEWLQMLDGNLQIQTTESVAEKEIKIDNWIEIPRYEVEQAITNKKAIQKEEQKLFEPNFEEGEIDLFHEIDEEVTKIATESVQFKNDMMTETLAKIYYKQGKIDKSLEIYNTLLIKNPEKSAYFASLIEKIEKEK